MTSSLMRDVFQNGDACLNIIEEVFALLCPHANHLLQRGLEGRGDGLKCFIRVNGLLIKLEVFPGCVKNQWMWVLCGGQWHRRAL